jgi:phenylpropionate dioxygenase-like ring-hydroxylating dioxygenase large terminal subunit
VAASFPLDTWYAAAWSHALGAELLAREIAGLRVVLYRRADGRPVALDDACWHRLLPLSMGRLDGEDVVCGYHGLRFDPDGRCVFMPSQETVNPSAHVPARPVVERHGLVWLWPGDPALADPATVPDFGLADHPGWVGPDREYALACGFQLVVDNLLDLTHETFVHASSIGNAAVAEAPFETTHRGTEVSLTRWMTDIDPPPFFAAHLGRPGRVDRWQIIRYQAPATVTIDVGVALTGTGAPQGDRSQGITMQVMHTVTPSTEGTCRFFWKLVRDYSLDDPSLTRRLFEDSETVLAEDKRILEAQQRALEAHPDRAFYDLNIDAAAVWSRRIAEEMITAEADGPAPTGPLA